LYDRFKVNELPANQRFPERKTIINAHQVEQTTSTPHQPASARFALLLQVNARDCCRMIGLIIREIKYLPLKYLFSFRFPESASLGS